MKTCGWVTVTLLAIGTVGCTTEPIYVPPESTYTRERVPVVVGGASEIADVSRVTPQFFAIEANRPLLGRFFVEPEYTAEGTAVAVLSHAYWKDRFKGEPAVIGTRVLVDGTPRTVVGVATQYLQPEKPASVYIPGTAPK
jgi:hypothetical protein